MKMWMQFNVMRRSDVVEWQDGAHNDTCMGLSDEFVLEITTIHIHASYIRIHAMPLNSPYRIYHNACFVRRCVCRWIWQLHAWRKPDAIIDCCVRRKDELIDLLIGVQRHVSTERSICTNCVGEKPAQAAKDGQRDIMYKKLTLHKNNVIQFTTSQ